MTCRVSRPPSGSISRDVRRTTSAKTVSVNLTASGSGCSHVAAVSATHGQAVSVRRLGNRHHGRKQAQTDKEHLEAQLRQSQKMEAIGTLAGGIAHDFNNILGAILGYGELAQQHAAAGSAMRRYLDNVMRAAGRAKALVDRILALQRRAR